MDPDSPPGDACEAVAVVLLVPFAAVATAACSGARRCCCFCGEGDGEASGVAFGGGACTFTVLLLVGGTGLEATAAGTG